MKRSLLIFLLAFALWPARGQEKGIEVSGDILSLALPAAAFTSTIIWKDGEKSTLRFIGAMGVSVAVTYSLKLIVDKERPNGERYSFPSGHASNAFTGAAFLQRRFGCKVGIPAYVLAAYTAWTRVYTGHHDYWDVLAGAAIGIGSSYAFSKWKKKNVTVSFNRTRDIRLVGLSYTF